MAKPKKLTAITSIVFIDGEKEFTRDYDGLLDLGDLTALNTSSNFDIPILGGTYVVKRGKADQIQFNKDNQIPDTIQRHYVCKRTPHHIK